MDTISWDRARAIFGNADPPRQVWEQHFDYGDDDLRRLAATPFQEINRDDLWYYFHDLAHVELQPDLFRYLFPVCLMEWHDTLTRNESCSMGDSEFHKGMLKGNVFEKMLTPPRQRGVVEFFRDSFLERIDAEPVSVTPSVDTHPFRWISRLNSLGIILPIIERLWTPWWNVTTRGRAIAVLKYCSGLIYYEGENSPFGVPVRNRGQYGPFLWENDSYIRDNGWLDTNLAFLRKTLSFEYLGRKLTEAASRLSQEPESDLAQMVLADAGTNRELVKSRITELPLLLSAVGTDRNEGWSV